MKFHLRGMVKIHPTEDLEKVRSAVENIFSVSGFEVTSEGETQTLTFESEYMESLLKMRNILKQDRVRDAVRKALNERVEKNRLRFYLNKQVAYVRHVSLCEPEGESPLGPVEVEVECEDPRRLIEWLTSTTTSASQDLPDRG